MGINCARVADLYVFTLRCLFLTIQTFSSIKSHLEDILNIDNPYLNDKTPLSQRT